MNGTIERPKTVDLQEIQVVDAEVYDKISAIIASGEIDQKTLAKKTGYSAAVISTYLKKTYNGDLVKLECAFKKYLNLSKISKNYQKITLKFERTSIAKRIFNVAQMCQLNSEIGICFGASGLGKTTAIKEYASRGSGVLFIDPNENSTPRAILKQIAEQLKVTEDMYPDAFMQDIVKKLKDSGYLVIVDEAENLKSECFRTLRKIHDRCNFSFGLLFVGTERLYANLRRLTGEFSYVTNRIGYAEKLDYLKSSDVDLIVKQIFPHADDDAVRAFEKLTNKNARILFNTIKRANDLLSSGTAELTPKLIASARNMLLM